MEKDSRDTTLSTDASVSAIRLGSNCSPLEGAADDDVFVVSVYIHEGLNFSGFDPSPDPMSSVVISAKLGDTLRTDPCALVERPQFNEEIGFKFPKEHLVAACKENKNIHIRAHLVSPEGGATLVGQFDLPLQDALPAKYTDLDNTPVYGLRKKKLRRGKFTCSSTPSLHLCLFYDRFAPTSPELKADVNLREGAEARNRRVRKEEPMDQGEDLQHTTEKVPPSHVATGLRLDKERGFFVIEGEGSESGVVDEFKLTIQLIYAKNLHLAVPSNYSPLIAEYSLRYNLFGTTELSTDAFYNLAEPEFPADNVVIKFAAASIELAADYFSRLAPHIDVRLVSGGQELAATQIKLRDLLKVEVDSLRAGTQFSIDEITFFESRSPLPNSVDRPRIGFALKLYRMGNEEVDFPEGGQDQVLEEEEAPEMNSNKRLWQEKLTKEVQSIEEWKLKKKERFKEQLKQLQSKHNEVLAAEWKRREKARELDFRSKMSEVDALAADLKKGIAAVDARERELTKKEKELAQEKQKLEKIKDRLSHAENVVEAESKQKALSLTEKIRELEDKLNTANARVEDLKISKTSYMKAWERAEQEVLALREESEVDKNNRLKSKDAEISRLRSENDSLRQQQQRQILQVPSIVPVASPVVTDTSSLADHSQSNHEKVAELKQRRKRMLDTGSYDEKDNIIKCLDREIKTLLQNNDAKSRNLSAL